MGVIRVPARGAGRVAAAGWVGTLPARHHLGPECRHKGSRPPNPACALPRGAVPGAAGALQPPPGLPRQHRASEGTCDPAENRALHLALTLSFPRVSTGPPASDFPSTSLAFLQGRGRLSSVTVHGPPLPEFPSDAAQVRRVGQGRHGSDVTSSPLSYTWRAQCASSC